MNLKNTYIYNIGKLLSVAVGAIIVALMAVGCGENTEVESIKSEAYIRNAEIKGESKNCAVVLHAQQGISYNINVTSEGSWASFSGGKLSVDGVMESNDKVVFITSCESNKCIV